MSHQALITAFQDILGEDNVFTETADRLTYSYDAAPLAPVIPAVVLRPRTGESLGRAVALCNDNRLPVTVRGAGTNLSGGTIPIADGAVIVTNGLDRIIEINEEDLYAVVQPGVITARFAAAVEARGLFYPPDPGSQAVSTLGGNVAENAGGLRGLKYGVTRNYVMAIEFFDAGGNMVKTGARTVKCATGYDLSGLLVGSEGTLGVFNEITLKLIPPPAARRAMLAVFDSIETASTAVAAIIAGRIVPATLEIMDNFTIRAVEDYSGVGLPVAAAALLLIGSTAIRPRWPRRPKKSRRSAESTTRQASAWPTTTKNATVSGPPAAARSRRWPSSNPRWCWKTPPCREAKFRPWSGRYRKSAGSSIFPSAPSDTPETANCTRRL